MVSNSELPWFCVVDPELNETTPIGHYHIYDLALCEAAERAGYRTLILGRKGTKIEQLGDARVIPAFSYGIWRASDLDYDKHGGHIRPLRTARHFFSELRAALAHYHLTASSYIFVQSVSALQVLGLAFFGLWCHFFHQGKLIVLLRYEPEHYQHHLAGLGFRIHEWLARAGSVRFVTESRNLAEDYRCLTTLSFDIVPIPFTRIKPSPRAVPRGPQLRFGSLGGARGEKGINEFLHAIEILNGAEDAPDIHFVLHVHSPAPDAQEKLAAFKPNVPKNVTLIEDPLDETDYSALLYNLDVVVLPYWHSVYRSRTSGALMEAIRSGKVVIVTRDTWLEEQMRQHGAGIACVDRSPSDLVRAIKETAAHYHELQAQALARAAGRSEHAAADQFIAQIVNLFSPNRD